MNKRFSRPKRASRKGVSPVGVAAAVSIALTLGGFVALGLFMPGRAGLGQGLGATRGPVLVATGLFALMMFLWTRRQSRKDELL